MPRHHSICRYCYAPVQWALTTPKGRWIPIDPDPHPDGSLMYITAAGARRVQVIPRDALALVPEGEPRYLAHAATCPVLAERRKRGRAMREESAR